MPLSWGSSASPLDHVFMPWSLPHLEYMVNDQKGFFLTFPCQTTTAGWVLEASGVVLFLDAGAEVAEQAMCAVVPTEDATVAWGSAAVQRQVLLRMRKRRVELCSLSQSLIDLAELMRKIQENVYYKLLLNEAVLN